MTVIRAVIAYILYCGVSLGLMMGAVSLAEDEGYRPACERVCASRQLHFTDFHYTSGRGAPIPSACHCAGAPKDAAPSDFDCIRREGRDLQCRDGGVFSFWFRSALVVGVLFPLCTLALVAFMRWGLPGGAEMFTRRDK